MDRFFFDELCHLFSKSLLQSEELHAGQLSISSTCIWYPNKFNNGNQNCLQTAYANKDHQPDDR